MFEYLSKNIKFPKSKENEDVKVRVVTSFTVEKDGSIKNVLKKGQHSFQEKY